MLTAAAGGAGFYNTSRLDMDAIAGEPGQAKENLVEDVSSFSPDMLDVFERFRFL